MCFTGDLCAFLEGIQINQSVKIAVKIQISYNEAGWAYCVELQKDILPALADLVTFLGNQQKYRQ